VRVCAWGFIYRQQQRLFKIVLKNIFLSGGNTSIYTRNEAKSRRRLLFGNNKVVTILCEKSDPE
jgi:hypothetical protein